MTTPTSRVIAYSIFRATSVAGQDTTTGTLSESNFGKMNNIGGGELVHGSNDGYGTAGPDRYWNGTIELTPFTFDIVEASDMPETLGPGPLTLNTYRTWRDSSGAEKTATRRYIGFFSSLGTGAWDRTTDTPRSMEFTPYVRIDGGGADFNTMEEENAALYVDTSKPVYRTRLNGTEASVDHYATIRTAHGVG